MNVRRKQQLTSFKEALARLDEALAIPRTQPLAIDGTIQRFEFAFELAWKTARSALLDDGLRAGSPRDVCRQAFSVGWISDEDLWLEMLEARNQCAHLYDEAMAAEVYSRIPRYSEALRAFAEVLVNR
jgi:nucleotidyltransferase substrate binding protein (TIGR01987 family)